jgi:hypothetical protein
VITLVYVSSATHLMAESELIDLLRTCRDNNAEAGITGMLLYKDGNFMQALEGPEDAVTRVHSKILADPRHKGLITLVREPLESRQFGEWSMAFRNVDLLSKSEQETFSPFLSDPFTEEYFGSNPNKALKLLLAFKKNVR